MSQNNGRLYSKTRSRSNQIYHKLVWLIRKSAKQKLFFFALMPLKFCWVVEKITNNVETLEHTKPKLNFHFRNYRGKIRHVSYYTWNFLNGHINVSMICIFLQCLEFDSLKWIDFRMRIIYMDHCDKVHRQAAVLSLCRVTSHILGTLLRWESEASLHKELSTERDFDHSDD